MQWGLLAGCRARCKIRNANDRNTSLPSFEFLLLSFAIVSDFELRISDFSPLSSADEIAHDDIPKKILGEPEKIAVGT
jgi:hypothetical protein